MQAVELICPGALFLFDTKMAFKQFFIGPSTSIKVYKRKSARNLRMSINSHGQVRVSIPYWAPYQAGVDFAKKRLDWIESNTPAEPLIHDGQSIGKGHHIYFKEVTTNRLSSRIVRNDIIISYPKGSLISEGPIQAKAKQAATKALKLQAEKLLSERLDYLAKLHHYEYKSLKIKKMTSRWGSCDQAKNITLNLYLMQLPWHLIDYVIYHELTHTKVFKHGPVFWQQMEQLGLKPKNLKLELKNYKTNISGM